MGGGGGERPHAATGSCEGTGQVGTSSFLGTQGRIAAPIAQGLEDRETNPSIC